MTDDEHTEPTDDAPANARFAGVEGRGEGVEHRLAGAEPAEQPAPPPWESDGGENDGSTDAAGRPASGDSGSTGADGGTEGPDDA